MTESTRLKIPMHLRRFIVDQNYGRYTPEDQAVWRYIMRQLKNFLSVHAHESYVSGLEKTGITVDRIPSIERIDEHLSKIGWGAVPVSGFIPPAAFMEFQSIGVLPIASDMRTLEHLLYTPAPDIVHEAAGHAPILAHPEYSAYLRQYGAVARNSILSKEDLDQYEAIRVLSDIKEDPRSTPKDIQAAEARLVDVNNSIRTVSEAALLSRMNWWTAEYGLIGNLKNPKIFGAGLLSSVGESRNCMTDKVRKIPLSVECVNYSYDITEQQPQLFVAEDFAHLGEVLEDLAMTLSYRRGGNFGLERAKEARTVNSVELNSGLQIAGVLSDYIRSEQGEQAVYLQFSGPCQLAFNQHELPNQGPARHPQGFSSPVGLIRGHSRCLSTFSPDDLQRLELRKGLRSELEFESGIHVQGVLKDWTYENGKLILLTWSDCRVTLGGKTLFDPSWGEYDMAVGQSVVKVFGGPADRTRFGQTDEFVAKRVAPRDYSEQEKKRHKLYQDIRDLREKPRTEPAQRWSELAGKFLEDEDHPWLAGLELVELSHKANVPEAQRGDLSKKLSRYAGSQSAKDCLRDGLEIAAQTL